MSKSSIEWCGHTWNPVTGCNKVSTGCKNCYAETMAKRLKAMGNPSYLNGFKVTMHHRMLARPYKRRKPTTYFVNSMSDLFHKDVPTEYIQAIFKVIKETPQHTYQILTKRPERVVEVMDELEWPDNLWMGVSVENADYTSRIKLLQKVPAKVRFLSVEPLLGPIPNLPLKGIHWVIVGGESGPKSRPMNEGWVTQIRDRCIKYNVPFFFKQWGGKNKKATGKTLEGRTWLEMPKIAGQAGGQVGGDAENVA